MAEAIVISIFLILLVYLQIKEQKKIVIKAKFNPVKLGLTMILAVLLLVIFWQPQLSDQVKLIAFAVMIVVFGFLSEGLGKDSLIKFGILSGEYQKYETIQLEATKNHQETFVSFYQRKNTRISLLVSQDVDSLVQFFNQLELSDKIVIGEITEDNHGGEKIS